MQHTKMNYSFCMQLSSLSFFSYLNRLRQFLYHQSAKVGKQSRDMQKQDRNKSSMQLSFHLKPAIEPPEGPESDSKREDMLEAQILPSPKKRPSRKNSDPESRAEAIQAEAVRNFLDPNQSEQLQETSNQQEIQRISEKLSKDYQHKTIEQKIFSAKKKHKIRHPILNKGLQIQKKPWGVVLYRGKSYRQSDISYKWAKNMTDSVYELRKKRERQRQQSSHTSKDQFLSKQYQEKLDKEDFLQIANGIISFQNEFRCRLLLKKIQKFRQSVFKLDEPHSRED